VAPSSSIPKRSGDRVKTDRRDSIMLARLARAGELTAVRVPDAVDEALRDLVRAREDAVREQRNVRHRLKALRNGMPYAGKSGWTAAHLRWLADLKLPQPAQQIAFTAGNAPARRALVEVSPLYRYPARVSAVIAKRQADCPQTGIDIAWAAQLRQQRSIHHPTVRRNGLALLTGISHINV
jgi:transposase